MKSEEWLKSQIALIEGDIRRMGRGESPTSMAVLAALYLIAEQEPAADMQHLKVLSDSLERLLARSAEISRKLAGVKRAVGMARNPKAN